MGSNPSQPADFSIQVNRVGIDTNKVSIDTFERQLKIHKGLSDTTIETYISCYRRFDIFVNNRLVTQRLIEDYLFESKNRRNNLAMLKALYPDLVKNFKFPRRHIAPKFLPSKVDLNRFYIELPDKYKVIFLALGSSGLRISELLNADIDRKNHMFIPKQHNGQTKQSGLSFYNDETAALLKDSFELKQADSVNHFFKKVARKIGIDIKPHTLRSIFAREMSLKGVQDRYIDAFCGRTPQSVLARHYSDYSPEVLKEIYEKAAIRILSK